MSEEEYQVCFERWERNYQTVSRFLLEQGVLSHDKVGVWKIGAGSMGTFGAPNPNGKSSDWLYFKREIDAVGYRKAFFESLGYTVCEDPA